jgi:hypothetical protein
LLSAFALPIIGGIGRGFDAGRLLGEDTIQSVFDGLTGGILQAGLNFAIEQMDIDNPLLRSLASAALTQTIASVLDPNGSVIEDLVSKAGVYAQKFVGDLSSTGFLKYAQTHGISKALEDHATSMFTRGAIEEIHRAGGIAQIISGRAQFVDYNGVTLTKVSVTDKEGFVLDRNGNFVGTFRENNGVKEEVFGQFDTSSGQTRLIEGSIRQTHPNGEVSYIEVRDGKTYRLVLKQRPVSSSATVKEVPCADTGATCVRFDLSEGGFEPIWDWEVVENYSGELNINGFNIKDGLHFIEGAAEINVTNGFAESLNQNFEEDDDLGEFVYRQDIDYLLLNGISSDEVAEGTPPSYFDPAISNSFVGSLAEEGVSKSKIDYVALYEDKHLFSDTITAMLLGLDPRELPESIIDIVADVLTVRLSNGFETKEVTKVRNAFDKMQLAGEDGFIPLGYSGGGAPLVNTLNTTVNGAAKYSFVETAIFVGSPIFSPITNPHVKTVINLYGDQDELEVGILNGWLEPGMLSDNDFGKGRTDLKQYNIVLEGITHTEYFFNPNEHPKKIQELKYLQSQLDAVKLEPGGGNPNIIAYLQEKIDAIEKVFYADAFVARLSRIMGSKVLSNAFLEELDPDGDLLIEIDLKKWATSNKLPIEDLMQRKLA